MWQTWQKSTFISTHVACHKTDNALCLSPQPSVGDRPKLFELQRLVGRNGTVFRIIEQVSHRWENIALALKFDGSVIDTTRMSCFFQVERACQSILQRWLEGATLDALPVTWEALLGCLEEVELNVLAKEVRSELLPWPNSGTEFAVFTSSRGANGFV